MNRIEVITSVERRRRFSRSEKERWVAALNEPGANAAEVARRAGIDRSLLYRWRQQLAASREGSSFVPVMIAPGAPKCGPEPSPAAITIEFSGGVRIRIEGAPDRETLAKAIS